MLEFKVTNQNISRCDNFTPASDSINYLTAHFKFTSDDWIDCIRKTAIFEVSGVPYLAVLDSGDNCLVPYSALIGETRRSKINVAVSVIGEKTNYRVTTVQKVIQVGRSGYRSDASIDPTEEQLNTITSGINDVIKMIEESGVLNDR